MRVLFLCTHNSSRSHMKRGCCERVVETATVRSARERILVVCIHWR
jgi:protein-tyrosine-phosphatase